MSLLPQYKSDTKFNEEESLPLWVNHDNEDDHDHKDDEESLPGYPPRHSDLYISGASGSGTKSHTITYILCKSWGREDEVLGVLGKSKEETIAITQRIFKELTSIPAERIELLVPFEQDNESGGKNTKWIKISDDAWSIRFDNSDDPPKSLKIKMIPTPEEEAESDRTAGKWCFAIIIIIILIISFFIYIHNTHKEDHDQVKHQIGNSTI